MGTILQLPAFPRHVNGILLNPSPTTSPYNHPVSLPGTPHLISSLSSLSSSASSSSPHNSDADHYFLTTSQPAKDGASSVPRNGAHALSTNGTGSSLSTAACRDAKKSSLSAPQTRKIRFAPLPEPRRDDLDLPDVFLDDESESITSLPLSSSLEISRPHTTQASSRPSSLLFSGAPAVSETLTDSPTPTHSTAIITPSASSSTSHQIVPLHAISSGSERYDSDVDPMTPQSPHAVLSSSSSFIERYPTPGTQSCPESPICRRVDLPRDSRKWSTKKLFKPFLGPLAKKEVFVDDALTHGLNQLRRTTTTDSDVISSGTTTPARNRSRERTESVCGSEKDVDFGMPLSRSSTSENAHAKPKCPKKKSLLSSLIGSDSSSSSDGTMWRTQSANAEIRRSKSRESTIANEDLRRTRSNSAGVTGNRPGARRQLKMLNGRVYGAKRNNLNNVNLFATARSDPEFVEWGYGGMGSVKTAASVGNNKYSRVQGSAALGSTEGAGWDKGSRGRPPTNDDDDGGGMAWVRRRKEERERAKREAAEKAAAEVAAHESQAEVTEAPKDEHAEEKPHAEVADPDPPVTTTVEQVEETQIKTVEPEERSTPIAVTENAEHVTTAVKIPAHTPSPRHHSISLGHHPNGHPMRLSTERTPSFASRHSIPRPPERRSSADTARAVSPVSQDVLTDAQEIVGELEGLEEQREEEVETVRERRQSGSSTGTASEDEDADAEYSPKEEDEEEDEEELTSKTAHALGAGVEKISRHKPNHSQDGVISPGA